MSDLVRTDPVIAKLTTARDALQSATTIHAVKKIADTAAAAEVYAKRQQLGEEAIGYAHSIKFEALARLGELLAVMPKNTGAAGIGTSAVPRDNRTPTLRDLGLDKKTSMVAQQLAALPADVRHAVAERETTLTQALRSEARRNETPPTPLPPGVFDVVLADPPWLYDNAITSWGPATLHYQAMETERICALNRSLEKCVADDATLFLWVTNPFLREGLAVVEAWGFTYKTSMVWIKRDLQRPGSGFYVRGHHELLFIATRGQHVPDQRGRAPISSVIEAPVGEHSAKPDASYSVIEALYPDASRLELFARRQRDGWTGWGNELLLQ